MQQLALDRRRRETAKTPRMEKNAKIFFGKKHHTNPWRSRNAGKLRYIGFTGHKDPAIHLKMLRIADERGFRFDTVQMPLNVMDPHFKSFEHQVLPVLLQKKIGV